MPATKHKTHKQAHTCVFVFMVCRKSCSWRMCASTCRSCLTSVCLEVNRCGLVFCLWSVLDKINPCMKLDVLSLHTPLNCMTCTNIIKTHTHMHLKHSNIHTGKPISIDLAEASLAIKRLGSAGVSRRSVQQSSAGGKARGKAAQHSSVARSPK